MAHTGRRFVMWLAAVATVSLAVGYGASFLVRSPEQVAADSSPPPRTRLTEPVQFGNLTSTVTADGRIALRGGTAITFAAPAETERAIVSGIRVAAGDEVQSGTVLAEISGRPVVVIPGQIPTFRTMTPGIKGTDVTQLQAGLRAAGYEVTDEEGWYGRSTAAAVGQWYEDLGYQAVAVGAGELDGAAEALNLAQRTVTDAERTLERAEAALVRLKHRPADETGTRPDTTAEVAAVDDAELALRRAREDRSKAEETLVQVRATTGPTVPFGELVFTPQLPSTVQQVAASPGDLVDETSSIVIGTSDRRVVAIVPRTVADQLRPGMPVEIFASTGGSVTGKLTSLERLASGENQDILQTEVIITPDDPIAADRDGEVVQVRIDASDPDLPESLLVPASALTTQGDGSTLVTVVSGDEEERVNVIVLGEGDGMVAVAAATDGALQQGDIVVTGIA